MATKSKTHWQKQESRPVRPFRSATDYLDSVGFRMYADEDFRTDEVIQTGAVEVGKLALAVRVPAGATNFEELVGVPVGLLRLVVTIEDRTFKDSEIAVNISMGEAGGSARVLDLQADAVERLSWAGETRVHVAVVLADPRTEGEVGTAQRVGAWVARKSFHIGKARDTAAFAINAVEPEYFEKLNLPSATTYLVEIADSDLNQSCENLPDLVKVSLAKDVHSALARDEDSAMAKALIRSIYVDVVTTVLATGYSNLVTEVQPDSIIEVVASKLAKSTGVSVERLRLLAKESAGAQLRAVVQADVELSRALVSAAQRKAA
ncbi:MAG: hypothetical protein EON54_13175 [Alcaligenaceae bacterium]|nr:MAG: hypothetical protein EON54_13175 [Alcaligenaceae bacterium]